MEKEKEKICSCCKNRPVGKGMRMLCLACYKLNGQKSRGVSSGYCDPGIEHRAGKTMCDMGV